MMDQQESGALRIGVAGISIECSTFSPGVTGYDDFTHYRGDDIASVYPFFASEPNVELLQWSRSIPGSPIAQESYRRIKREILEHVESAGGWPALYMMMHGAMAVAGIDDAEGDFFSALRELVGPDCLIVSSYDLHGNLSPTVFDTVDAITAYRHAPHVDSMETRLRGYRLTQDYLEKNSKPEKCWIGVPLLLPGEKTSTEWEPAKSLYAELGQNINGVTDASILIGYAWADEPRSGASVLVYGDDHSSVENRCLELASKMWSLRDEFRFGVEAGSIEFCLKRATEDIAGGTTPVVISDSGDNPTAGGAGDVAESIPALLESELDGIVYASIPDSAAIERCYSSSIGDTVGLMIGGKLDPIHGGPLAIAGKITALCDDDPWNRKAVLECQGVRIIITERRTPYHHKAQFIELGIDPEDCSILVVKIGYLVPELKLLAAASYLALSGGAVDQEIEHLTYNKIRRPLYPLDMDMDFNPKAVR